MSDARIRILPPETARKIAAGEVIDRPAAVVRELLDNAIDSGAREIAVELSGGGLESVRVVDDGLGMGEADLAACTLPHATSKITSIDDLETLSTLGFRGEALGSIAAVSRLSIASALEGSGGHRLSAGPGREPFVEPFAARRGTAVEAAGLFEELPARRRFMKRPASEAALCRQVLLDKALPFPELGFRYLVDGRLALRLPPSTRVERVVACLAAGENPALFEDLVFSGSGFSGRVVTAGPTRWRNDRRAMAVFANRRRIQEFGLLQALDWAFEGFLPGGAHPLAALLLDIDPALVDFNIHPAKREARFRDLDSVRRAVVRAVQDRLRSGLESGRAAFGGGPAIRAVGALQPGFDAFAGAAPGRPGPSLGAAADGAAHSSPALRPAPSPGERASWEKLAILVREKREAAYGSAGSGSAGSGYAGPAAPDDATGRAPGEPAADGAPAFRYIGRALGVFLAFELDGELWLLDQHAAHERVLFDRLVSEPPVVQELLVPLELPVSDEAEEDYLAAVASELDAAGWRVAREGGTWLLTALPAGLASADAASLLDLLGRRPDPREIGREARATAACRAAVKDGDELDPDAARELIALALALPVPRCPHGRPIAARFRKEDLFRLVERIV
ncbi:MAG: DNA mismatch repair endonuclease MutL [Spirochaetia bacterium]|nr:DNA mismatch repair endonuclease MutL [Spirochaetia bacterium]